MPDCQLLQVNAVYCKVSCILLTVNLQLWVFRPPILRTHEDGRVYLHPKSVNAQVTSFEDNFLIYHEKMKSSSVGYHS